ncbi:hypothetical protein U9M48_001732 [Paspalum notatum var. saurae]|uniref:Integrase catalytic domain-containing protein n=1 Tax=Paspalum notatum var. saurae TaxID=547442 RepID=A0AAQ3PIQ4_PASNO
MASTTHSSSSSIANSNPFAPFSPAEPPSAAAIAMLNIKGHVPEVLDMDASNFRQWRTFFDLTFEKFGLTNHVDGSLDAVLMRDDAEWIQIDACIVSWLYTTVSKAIMDAVYKPRRSAHSLWTAIKDMFLDNGLQRAVLAQQEFHSLYQGDLSIAEYTGRLKSLADTLYDVGAAVTDHALVVNTLRGLNDDFHSSISVLTSQKPPPSFLFTRSYLLQEETRIRNSRKLAAATALLAANASAKGGTPQPPPPAAANVATNQQTSNNPLASGGGNDRRKKRKKTDGHEQTASTPSGSGARPPSAPPGAAPWTSMYNPWTGMVQAWPVPTWRPPAQGVLGPRPTAVPQQAMMALQAPSYVSDANAYAYNLSAPPPALFNTLHGTPAQAPLGGNGGSDWFLDTSATSHMASNTGQFFSDVTPPVISIHCGHPQPVILPLMHYMPRTTLSFGTTVLDIPARPHSSGKSSKHSCHACRLGKHLTCPYTFQQNGHAERVLRTLNDSMRTLLFHASVPIRFWPDALATATYLLNRRPSRVRQNTAPFQLLFCATPDYEHLRVFVCLCYPNIASTAPHKLAARSIACVFLGYLAEQRGYRCYDPVSRRVITSRHVYFDETVFPFARLQLTPSPPSPAPQVFQEFLPQRLARRHLRAPSPPAASSPPVPSDTSHPTPVPSPASTTAPPPPPVPFAPPPPAAPARHTMITRARAGLRQPNPKYANVCTTLPSPAPPPTTVRGALRDPDWRQAMQDEYDALVANGTWTLVPRPPGAHIITGKWIFKNKLLPDGSLERRKARWVVRGFTQCAGVDFHQTFSPVVKPATIRTVLHLAASRQWPVHQLDVKNAFLHGELSERVHCLQPAGFVDPEHPDHVCLLAKSLYGLKQAPRAWFQRLGNHLQHLGFLATGSDASLFVYRDNGAMAYLLVYVDDIILTASSAPLLMRIVDKLSSEFAIKDLGPLKFFLGVQVHCDSTGFHLHQAQYAEDILERAGMSNCKPAPTPVDTKPKLSINDGTPMADASFYRSIAGALQYLTMTRPDIAYAVNQICLYMHAPRDAHWNLVKRILRYVRGTLDHGIKISASTSTELIAYSDADWAGCPDTRRSTSGYCVYVGDSLTTVSCSSAEAEYRGVANAAAECCWVRNLLHELYVPVDKATVIYCDNVSAIYLSENPVHHRRTKHVELDIHFVREKVALGQMRVVQVPTDQQYADIMTKGLSSAQFKEFRSSSNQILATKSSKQDHV